MMGPVAIGLGAGLASALLFSVVITGSPLAIALSYAAPLPVLIAALGWNHRSGLLAAAIGALAVGLVLRAQTGLAYAIGSGLPAWWLAYLALLARANPRAPDQAEWYPLGRLLLWTGACASLVVLAGSVAIGGGDFAAYTSLLERVVGAFVRYEADIGANAPLSPGDQRFVAVIASVVPTIAAAVFCLFFVANTWMAARAVAISGRLVRPWPFLPGARMPPAALALLALGIIAAFGPGFVGVAGMAAIGGAGMAFALQGLALLHRITLGKAGRLGILICTYVLTVFFGGTFLPLMALAGIVDTTAALRRPPSPGPKPD